MNDGIPETAESLASAPATDNGMVDVTSPVSDEKAASIASAVVAKRRGRHPKDCPCNRCEERRRNPKAAKLDVTTNEQAPVDPIVAARQAELAKQVIVAITHSIDTFSIIYLTKKARKVNAPEVFMSRIKTDVIMRDYVRNGITESGVAVAQKYGVDIYIPELALLGFATAHIASLVSLGHEIEQLAKRETVKAKT